jgi:hypothetical protein
VCEATGYVQEDGQAQEPVPQEQGQPRPQAQRRPLSHLAVVLPGRAYGPEGPAILIPLMALRQQRAVTVVGVRYPESDPGPVKSVAEQIALEVAAHEPTRVTFVAKSLGTMVLARLDPAVVGSAMVDAIWLTPIFREVDVREGAIAKGWRSLLVAGDADEEHVPEAHEAVRVALDAESLILPDANHSLEVERDLAATLERWAALAEVALAFASH